MHNWTASVCKTLYAIWIDIFFFYFPCVFYCFLICFAVFTDKINFRSLSHDVQRLTDIIKNSKESPAFINTTGPN